MSLKIGVDAIGGLSAVQGLGNVKSTCFPIAGSLIWGAWSVRGNGLFSIALAFTQSLTRLRDRVWFSVAHTFILSSGSSIKAPFIASKRAFATTSFWAADRNAISCLYSISRLFSSRFRWAIARSYSACFFAAVASDKACSLAAELVVEIEEDRDLQLPEDLTDRVAFVALLVWLWLLWQFVWESVLYFINKHVDVV